ncbi:hypothetical protein ACO1PF_12090 [Alkalibacterium sp. f15]|uniref:hypothetical protein n=1 Tax=Alkalibacterium sp. f15 TaxID=3414029 RepID=UPI003BF8DF4C
MKNSKKRLFLYIVLLLISLAVFYIYTPALNIHSQEFRFLIIMLTVAVIAIEITIDGQSFYNKKLKYGAFIIPILIVIGIAVGNLVNGVLFRATDYADLIEVEEKNFQEDYPAMDESSIPMMDRDTAQRLGDRRIGSISELVSQFVPAETYT